MADDLLAGDLTIAPSGDIWDSWDSWDLMPLWEVSGSDSIWDDYDSWDDMLSWYGSAGESLLYTMPIRDLGARYVCYAMVDVETDDQATATLRYSSDLVAWSPWGAPSRTIDGRYVQCRVRVVSASPPEPPVVSDINMTIVVIPKLLSVEGVSTLAATGDNRYGVGDIRVPVEGFSKIGIVQPTITGGDAMSSRVVDKEYLGPRIQFFSADGAPAEAVFDLFIRGYPNA